jgi:hypothetical protein
MKPIAMNDIIRRDHAVVLSPHKRAPGCGHGSEMYGHNYMLCASDSHWIERKHCCHPEYELCISFERCKPEIVQIFNHKIAPELENVSTSLN